MTEVWVTLKTTYKLQTVQQTDRQTDRQTDSQTDRQAGRQADRQKAVSLSSAGSGAVKQQGQLVPNGSFASPSDMVTHNGQQIHQQQTKSHHITVSLQHNVTEVASKNMHLPLLPAAPSG